MRAIAKVVGFPPELWFEENLGPDGKTRLGPIQELPSITEKVNRLFEVVRNESTGEPYTDAEAARMCLGDISAVEVEGIRSGEIADPTVGQVSALADAFGVDPSYLVERKGSPSLDRNLLEALGDDRIRELVEDVARLPEREKRVVIGIARQFGEHAEGIMNQS